MNNPVRNFIFLLAISAAVFAQSNLDTAPLPDAATAPRPEANPFVVEPRDRVLLQRAFVPFEGSLRLYACVVGSPVGAHYAYDFDTGALLSVWKGPFADLSEMWRGRALNQTAQPAGRETVLNAKPLIALFPNRLLDFPKAWPDNPDPLYAFEGYELEPDGQPVFRATLDRVKIRDRVAATPDGRGITRQFEFAGKLSVWETWLLLGEADTIEPNPDGNGWRATGPKWTLEWPADSPYHPVVREAGERKQLVVRLEQGRLSEPVVYTLTW